MLFVKAACSLTTIKAGSLHPVFQHMVNINQQGSAMVYRVYASEITFLPQCEGAPSKYVLTRDSSGLLHHVVIAHYPFLCPFNTVKVIIRLDIEFKSFFKQLNPRPFGINVKFNAGFLHPADGRAVHLHFGGGGGQRTKQVILISWNMYGLFSPSLILMKQDHRLWPLRSPHWNRHHLFFFFPFWLWQLTDQIKIRPEFRPETRLFCPSTHQLKGRLIERVRSGSICSPLRRRAITCWSGGDNRSVFGLINTSAAKQSRPSHAAELWSQLRHRLRLQHNLQGALSGEEIQVGAWELR